MGNNEYAVTAKKEDPTPKKTLPTIDNIINKLELSSFTRVKQAYYIAPIN